MSQWAPEDGSQQAPPLPDVLARWLGPIEEALHAAVPHDSTQLVSAARYVMGWDETAGPPSTARGKRIRPALTLAAAAAVAGRERALIAMPAAVAVELVHNFSLVHDEIQDHDAERHHRPTVWALHGEGQAINVGDYLYVRAVQALSDGPGQPERRMRALSVLNRAITQMLAGQWLDLSFESRESVSVDAYLEMVAGKTGALVAAPLEMGVILGGEDDIAPAMGAWGLRLGMAFQAQDDYLGTWGQPAETGKSNVNDIARRKKTLPVVFGLADPAAGPIIRDAFQHAPEPGDVRGVVTALERCGADRFTREAARRFADEASEILEHLELAPAVKREFQAVADFLVNRRA